MYVTQDWVQFALDLPVRELPRSCPASRSFSYCTGGAAVLGELLEAATGTSVAQFAADELSQPLGIQDARWPYSPLALEFTGGGLELRSSDLLQLARLYLQLGTHTDRQVVSLDWVTTSLEPHVHVAGSTSYGHLCWLTSLDVARTPVNAQAMSGMGGNRVSIFPDLDAISIITTTNYRLPGAHDLTDRLLVEHVLPPLIRSNQHELVVGKRHVAEVTPHADRTRVKRR